MGMAIGAAGGVLIAIAAWLVGALPGRDPGPHLGGGLNPTVVIGVCCWFAGAFLLSWAWWRERRVRPAQLIWALPVLLAPPLGSRDVYAYACQGWIWVHGSDPYAMGVADGGCPWVSSVPVLWWHTPTPYGPLAIAVSGLAALPGSLIAAIVLLRLTAVAGVALTAFAVGRTAPRSGAVWLGVLTPLMLVHGVSGAHNDALLAGLLTAALLMARARQRAAAPSFSERLAGETSARRRDMARARQRAAAPSFSERLAGETSARRRNPAGELGWRAWVAGALLGGAVAVKVTAIVAVPFVLVLLGRRWWQGLGGAVGAFGGLTLVTGLGLGWIGALGGTGELVQWSSLPSAVGMTVGYVLRALGHPEGVDEAVAVCRALGLVTLAGVGAAMLLRAWRERERPGRVVLACGVAMAAVVLLGPVAYPWYALAPLAVLAAADRQGRWERALPWATVGILLLSLPNGLGIPAMTKPAAVLVTAALITAACLRVRHRAGPRARA